MTLVWIVCTLVGLYFLVLGVDVFRNRHPLQSNEVAMLVRKKRRCRALAKYEFSSMPCPVEASQKKAMRGEGEFVAFDVPFIEAPARIAGLLKYKKHEWIVIAFVFADRVKRVWWNKGPDGTRVWSMLGGHSLQSMIRSLRPDAIAILHNHPNPNPSQYRMNIPSDADLKSAGFYDAKFDQHGISLLEFICERGVPHLYFASFGESVVPVGGLFDEIVAANGRSILGNYSLRKELRRNSQAEAVVGSTLPGRI